MENINQNEDFSLDTNYIQELVDNYRNNQLFAINSSLEIEDSQSIHFDLKTLKDFIAIIEEKARIEDPNISTEDLGVHFYFGAYSQETPENIPDNYAQRHTLVMVPTKTNQGIIHDYNPYAESIPSKWMAQNHGILSPPAGNIIDSF